MSRRNFIKASYFANSISLPTAAANILRSAPTMTDGRQRMTFFSFGGGKKTTRTSRTLSNPPPGNFRGDMSRSLYGRETVKRSLFPRPNLRTRSISAGHYHKSGVHVSTIPVKLSAKLSFEWANPGVLKPTGVNGIRCGKIPAIESPFGHRPAGLN